MKEKEIEQAKKDYEDAPEKRRGSVCFHEKRIQFMYEQGDSAYLQVLLESQNYADMVNKADYIESLYEYDKQLWPVMWKAKSGSGAERQTGG